MISYLYSYLILCLQHSWIICTGCLSKLCILSCIRFHVSILFWSCCLRTHVLLPYIMAALGSLLCILSCIFGPTLLFFSDIMLLACTFHYEIYDCLRQHTFGPMSFHTCFYRAIFHSRGLPSRAITTSSHCTGITWSLAPTRLEGWGPTQGLHSDTYSSTRHRL